MTGWRAQVAWAVAALAGLVLAAGLSTAASTLSRQRIGLSSEPLAAGRALAPTPERRIPYRPPRGRHPRPRPTATATATATAVPRPTAAPPRDDSTGGEDRGAGDD